MKILPIRKRRSRSPRSGRPRGAELEQRHLDLIGLGLLAAGLYLAFVLYLGWDGGRVGGAVADGLAWLVGALADLVPLLLIASGAALALRPLLPSRAALNAGAILVCAGLLLAFAAETLALGPDRPERRGFFDPDFVTAHGGVVGETLYWVAATLFQRIGAHILALAGILAGALLMSGATISSLIERGGRAARRATEVTTEMARVARQGGGLREALGIDPDRGQAPRAPTELTEPFGPPVPGEAAGGEPPDDASDEGPADAIGAPPFLLDDEPEESDDDGPADEDAYASRAEPGDEPPNAKAGGEASDADLTPMGNRRTGGITESDEIDYQTPPAKLLRRGAEERGPDTRDREAVAASLLEALGHFGVEAQVVGTVSGPHVSRYELQLAPGTKVGKIAQLKDDLAYALASTEIRILAPIPGKRAVGVEVPNQRRRIVRLGDIYQGRPKGASPLVGWLGKDVSGHAIWTDVAAMPHVLVAGTTGSGKSGCVNALLSSILMHASPNEVRMVLVDPKRVELNHYESLPHLLTPVVTAPRLAATVLGNLIGEMESRYSVMGEARARNLDELNRARRRAGEAPLPHVLCVIDELADLMMIAPAEVEDAIIRLAQKSRAVGLHLVLATQRPSTDVITGTIKVNIPARIAFAVASQVDSRVILDQGGAESLLGQGDMLFRGAGTSKLQRIQGAFVTEEEISRLCRHWSRQGEPEFDQELLEARAEPEEAADGELSADRDDLLADAMRICVETQTASVSMIQRRLRVGYTRAGRLIDMLERRGVISGYEGSKPRQVLVTEADLPRLIEGGEAAGASSGEGAGAELETLSG